MLLRQRPLAPEIRYRDEAGEIKIESPAPPPEGAMAGREAFSRSERRQEKGVTLESLETPRTFHPKKIYPYGIGQNRLRQAARTLRVPITIVDDLEDADVLMTLKSYYRKHPQPITMAERLGKPVYILRSNTVFQMESCLADIFSLSSDDVEEASVAMRETQEAIQKVLSGTRSVELTPQSANIRREQHQMAREANLISHSLGREPYRRVRIYRDAQVRGEP
jgi:hypothetical protein